MIEFDYISNVDLGLSYGLLTGIIVPFAGWALRLVFKAVKTAFE